MLIRLSHSFSGHRRISDERATKRYRRCLSSVSVGFVLIFTVFVSFGSRLPIPNPNPNPIPIPIVVCYSRFEEKIHLSFETLLFPVNFQSRRNEMKTLKHELNMKTMCC